MPYNGSVVKVSQRTLPPKRKFNFCEGIPFWLDLSAKFVFVSLATSPFASNYSCMIKTAPMGYDACMVISCAIKSQSISTGNSLSGDDI
jgi:hypothetical protein